MAIPRWNPRQELSRQEQFLMKRLDRTRKLFGFLRAHRQELFDEQFQRELESMYRDSGAGKEPNPPAMMAMALVLQSYVGASDAEAVELTVVDLRWQMVLGRLAASEPAFSQGSIAAFRERLIEHDLDQRLLERTVELAKRTKEFDWRKLPKHLHLAIDSSPLEGAGRVEDTVNLLGHAARKVVACAAALVGHSLEQVANDAGIPVLLGSSIKQALDVQWSDPAQKDSALQQLLSQLDSLERWLLQQLPSESAKPPLREAIDVLRQLRAQDLEPDPGGGGSRIREGVAPDRRVSIEDGEMRHGRKSKSKLFNGYKRHLAVDVDSGLILAGAVTPGNRPEETALPDLEKDLAGQGRPLVTLYIDRGYISSPLVERTVAAGGDVVCRPWVARNGDLFSKDDFAIDLEAMTITCPAGQTEPIRFGAPAQFSGAGCDPCPLRVLCTNASAGSGRTVSIASDEPLQQRLREASATRVGRMRLRTRTTVEHSLAHLARRQGRRARYRGLRKNLFDLRRASSVLNLETLHRQCTTRTQAQKVAS
jgi:hypothetical protein